jgi:hypothetical protein
MTERLALEDEIKVRTILHMVADAALRRKCGGSYTERQYLDYIAAADDFSADTVSSEDNDDEDERAMVARLARQRLVDRAVVEGGYTADQYAATCTKIAAERGITL